MNRVFLVSLAASGGALVAIVVSGFLSQASVAAPSSPTTPPAVSPAFGTAVRPASETQWIAAQVLVVSADLTAPTPLFLSRAAFNRLRAEAGAQREQDCRGLTLAVVVGDAAQPWGLKPGTQVSLRLLASGVDVPESNIAGDDWFTQGVAVLEYSPDCP